MDRLISLFREASEADDPRGRPPNPPAGDEPGLPEQQPFGGAADIALLHQHREGEKQVQVDLSKGRIVYHYQ